MGYSLICWAFVSFTIAEEPAPLTVVVAKVPPEKSVSDVEVAVFSITLAPEPEPLTIVPVLVPLEKSESDVFTTDAVLDAISKSSPPLTTTISEEAEEYWLQAL